MELLLPDFLGIGAPRAGTTWLHEVLAAHPDVLMPSRRKELNFFDNHFHRGLEWYAASFDPPDPAAGGARPRAVGEVTPVYMYREPCRERIRTVPSIRRFVVCLRDPVDLLWSGYRQNSAIFNFQGDLAAFMEEFPHVVANGFYARALRPWFDEFGRDRFLLLDFGEIVGDPERALARLGDFLDVDPARFPAGVADEQRNRTYTPRFPRLHSWAKRGTTRLYRSDLTWVVDLAKRLGLRRLVRAEAAGDQPGGSRQVELSPEQRAELHRLYADDLGELEDLTGLQLAGRPGS
jgi:hypothetical protein